MESLSDESTPREAEMKKKDKTDQPQDVFDQIEGLTSVDADDIKEFEVAMNDQVIPEIVEVVEKRRMLAAKTRHWHLKC